VEFLSFLVVLMLVPFARAFRPVAERWVGEAMTFNLGGLCKKHLVGLDELLNPLPDHLSTSSTIRADEPLILELHVLGIDIDLSTREIVRRLILAFLKGVPSQRPVCSMKQVSLPMASTTFRSRSWKYSCQRCREADFDIDKPSV
jgi:hypothetical protein